MDQQGTDLVEIRGLKLRGRHGVTEEERATDQPLVINLAARLDARPAAILDDLASTLDYEEAVRQVAKIVTGESFPLLETLRDPVARAILSHPRLAHEWVRG